MELRVLGPVEARVDGSPVDLGHARQRGVLGALLVEAGRPVPTDRLVERVWGEESPLRALNALYGYVSRLRRALAVTDEVTIGRTASGYVLRVEPERVDLHRFRALLAESRAQADPHRALDLAERAQALWRGPALACLDSPWARTLRESLDQERLGADTERIDLALASGRHGALVAELSARAAAHPLDERLAEQLMLALYRSGRAADALEHYRRVRSRVVEELGIEPTPALQQLHQHILGAHPTADPPAPGPAAAVPRQLPLPPPGFTGRTGDLAALDRLLDAAPGSAVAAVTGTAGMGKTWLALHWAHRHADRFPDGQLFVDLCGFGTQDPLPPDVVVRGFLEALGVAPAAVPTDPPAQTALYRTLLADRRVLVVLDNARDADQVVPLLPGGPKSAVIVTSRNRLTRLDAAFGVRALLLDVLSGAEARQVLADRLGPERTEAEPGAVANLLAHCNGFPLALAIVAVRARSTPAGGLSSLADELREAATRLDALDDPDPAASVPGMLSWSHAALPPEQARLFALLGIAPGTDTGLVAAANLAGLPVPGVRAALRGLEDANLVRRHVPDRYRMHDLIRLYAAARARDDLSEAERSAALRRLVGGYLLSAHAGERLLNVHGVGVEVTAQVEEHAVHSPADEEEAWAWFTAEHPALLAAQRLAADRGWHDYAWQLASTLNSFHWRTGRTRDAVALWGTGLAAAAHLDDPAALTRAHRHFGHACGLAGRHDDAVHHLGQALELAERTGDRTAQAHTHHAMEMAYERLGDDRRALEHAVRALELYRAVDLPDWEAAALNAVGWYRARLGHHDEARTDCEAALAKARRHGNRPLEVDVLDSLGYIDHHTGRHRSAVGHYRQAIALTRDIGDHYNEATTLDRLAHTHVALGEHDQARACRHQALELYRAQHRTADADRTLRQLAEADAPCGPTS